MIKPYVCLPILPSRGFFARWSTYGLRYVAGLRMAFIP
ncbi:hypothetical protein D881_01445 [Corynebacterium ulcerans NCTC 12077]|nr:hypothetical protein D881_01445 [Corynebacterium ulcerans NCTC 12077]